jgi:hypothetical protein
MLGFTERGDADMADGAPQLDKRVRLVVLIERAGLARGAKVRIATNRTLVANARYV